MKYGVAPTPASQVTGRPFILPSHLLIESSPAATASRYELLPRFKVGPGAFYMKWQRLMGIRRIACAEGDKAWKRWDMLLQFICVRLQPLCF